MIVFSAFDVYSGNPPQKKDDLGRGTPTLEVQMYAAYMGMEASLMLF